MALLYADENFPHPVVAELRRLGHDVLTSQDAGQANQEIEDDQVLAFAHSSGRAVLTQNRKHFRHLHQAGRAHSGIIACTVDPDFCQQAARIHAAITTVGELSGQFLRVNRPPR